MFITIISFSLNGFYYITSLFYFMISILHTVLPFGIDVGLLGVGAYYLTKLKKPDNNNVISVFGHDPTSKDGDMQSEKVVRCIAHRGAGLDAPENTLEAFKYCVERDCNFVELDVRSSKDGKLLLLHDQGLGRLAASNISDVHAIDWDKIKDINIGATHPNRSQFKEAHICLLDDALDYLLDKNVRVIIDIKGEDKQRYKEWIGPKKLLRSFVNSGGANSRGILLVSLCSYTNMTVLHRARHMRVISQVINGVLKTFANRPKLYQYAAITCFNPYVLYQIRKKDPQIVGALSYRPYCFSAQEYDAENGPSNPRYSDNVPLHAALRVADAVHSLLWRWTARWCAVSAVLLHKDIVSASEIYYWRCLGVRCAGWSVNRPLEKLYWRGVLKAPYLANTLLGEPDVNKKDQENNDVYVRPGPLIDKILESERRMSSGQN